MEKILKILILEDNPIDAEIIQRLLVKEPMSCKFCVVSGKVLFIRALDEFIPDVIISDHSLPKFNSTEALMLARQKLPNVPFIMVTGTVSEEFAVSIFKQGADDYILKDRMARLPSAIITALEQRRASKEISDYKYALDQAAIVAITDQKGIILYANENFCSISKYTSGELIGQDHRIVNSGHHPPAFIENLWRTIAHGKIWRGEFCNQAKDGSRYWVDSTIIPFLDNKGKPYQYLAIRYDITEKKTIQDKLKQSEQKYRNIFLQSPLPNWIFDSETLQFLDVNDAAVSHYGFSREEFLNMSILDIRNKEEAEILLKDLDHIKYEHDSRHGTWLHQKKNGEQIIMEITAHPIEYNNRKARLVVANDITETKKAEEALRKSEFRLKEAQSIAHISNYDVDLVNGVHTWSDEYYRIFGINKEEVKPSLELFKSFVHPDDAEFTNQKITALFQHHEDSFMNFRFIRKDNQVRYGHSEWKFEFDKNGKPIRLFGIMQDVTEKTEAEEHLKELEKKIMEQKIQQQKKVARAIIKGQEKERNHIGKELHDNINQMLAGTKIYLGIAGKKSEEVKKIIEYPMELVDRSIEEIRALCSRLVTPVKNINLEDLVKDLAARLSQHNTIKTGFIYAVPHKLISDDLKLNIYRIIQELSNNTIKYADAKHVNFIIETRDHTIRVVVEDDGNGFDMNEKRTGIGISNIINRAETFNGRVEILTSPGNGCKTIITIPW